MAQLVRAPPCHGGGRGFDPHPGRYRISQYSVFYNFGILAQLGEHLPYKQRVTGSSPVGPTMADYKSAEYIEYADMAQFQVNSEWNELLTGRAADYKSAEYIEYADMAQLAEQLICNQQVEGSSPPIGF